MLGCGRDPYVVTRMMPNQARLDSLSSVPSNAVALIHPPLKHFLHHPLHIDHPTPHPIPIAMHRTHQEHKKELIWITGKSIQQLSNKLITWSRKLISKYWLLNMAFQRPCNEQTLQGTRSLGTKELQHSHVHYLKEN